MIYDWQNGLTTQNVLGPPEFWVDRCKEKKEIKENKKRESERCTV